MTLLLWQLFLWSTLATVPMQDSQEADVLCVSRWGEQTWQQHNQSDVALDHWHYMSANVYNLYRSVYTSKH